MAIDSELVVVPKVMSLVEVMHPVDRIIGVEVSREGAEDILHT